MRSDSKHTINNRGVSLVELIITIVVISVMALPLSLVMKSNVEAFKKSQELMNALNLAEHEMALAKNVPFSTLGTISAYDLTWTDGVLYTIERTVYPIGAGTLQKDIEVKVRREDSPGKYIITLITRRHKDMGYGAGTG